MNNTWAAVEALAERIATEGITCECGHFVGEDHDSNGCHAVVTYEPMVRCPCALLDDQDEHLIVADQIRAVLPPTDTGDALGPQVDAQRVPYREYVATKVIADHRLVGVTVDSATGSRWTCSCSATDRSPYSREYAERRHAEHVAVQLRFALVQAAEQEQGR